MQNAHGVVSWKTETCSSFEIDIITLDLSNRLPFSLKFGPVNLALQRGLFFEITYAPTLRCTCTLPLSQKNKRGSRC